MPMLHFAQMLRTNCRELSRHDSQRSGRGHRDQVRASLQQEDPTALPLGCRWDVEPHLRSAKASLPRFPHPPSSPSDKPKSIGCWQGHASQLVTAVAILTTVSSRSSVCRGFRTAARAPAASADPKTADTGSVLRHSANLTRQGPPAAGGQDLLHRRSRPAPVPRKRASRLPHLQRHNCVPAPNILVSPPGQ